MEDGIIKGTGNSRLIKSVPNLLTLCPTWQEAAAMMIAGTFPIDLYGLNPAGWDELGTKIGKATLLDDATAKMLGDVYSPNEAFAKLVSLVKTAQSTADGKIKYETGTYVGNGGTSIGIHTSGVPLVLFVFGMNSSTANNALGIFARGGRAGVGTYGRDDRYSVDFYTIKCTFYEASVTLSNIASSVTTLDQINMANYNYGYLAITT